MSKDNKKLFESLNKNFFPERDISNPNYSVTVFHPARKDITFAVEDSAGMKINNFDMYSVDMELGMNGDKLIKRFRQLALHPIAGACVEEIVNDCIVLENEVVKVDTAELADLYGDDIGRQVEESFDKIKELLEFENMGDIYFMQSFIDGILPFECIYDNKNIKNGIIRMDQMSPFGLRKVYQIDKKRFVWRYVTIEGEENKTGLSNMDLLIPAQERFGNIEELQEEQCIVVHVGQWDSSKMMYLSPIYKVMKPLNQLNLIEDNLIMYRLTHSADTRVFKIDTGKMQKDKAEAYVAKLKRMYEQKKYYRADTGEVDEQKQVRVIGENFWFPVDSDGRGSSVDMLAGGNMDLGDLKDLDHFIKQIYTGFNVPKSRRSLSDESPEVRWSSMSDPNILREELSFSKMNRGYRKNFETLFYEAVKRDMIAKKQIIMSDWYKIRGKIKFVWESDNYYNTMKDFFVLDQKLSLLEKLEPFIDSGYFTMDWAIRNVLKFTREEWEDMQNEKTTFRKKNIEFEKDKKDKASGDYEDMGGTDGGGFDTDQGADNTEGEAGGDMGSDGGGDEFSGFQDNAEGTEGSTDEEIGSEFEEFSDEELVDDTNKKGEEASYIKDSVPNPTFAKNLILNEKLNDGDTVKINKKQFLVEGSKLVPRKR